MWRVALGEIRPGTAGSRLSLFGGFPLRFPGLCVTLSVERTHTDRRCDPKERARQLHSEKTYASARSGHRRDRRFQVFGFRLTLMLAMAVLAAACSRTTLIESGGSSSLATPPIESPSPAENSIDGLSESFLAFVYPLTADDLVLGRRTFEEPLFRNNMLALGSCIEAEGFREVAPAFREATMGVPSEAWQFPDLARLRQRGFSPHPADTAMSLMGSLELNTAIADPQHPLLQVLAQFPELGVAATLEAANGLNEVLSSCVVANQMTEAFDSASQVMGRWRSELRQLDETPAIAAEVTAFVVCVRSIDAVFADVADVGQWWAAEFGQMINLDLDPDVSETEFESELVRWGQGYAECVEPVVDAREETRFAARQKHVDRESVRLLEIQANLMEDLEPRE